MNLWQFNNNIKIETIQPMTSKKSLAKMLKLNLDNSPLYKQIKHKKIIAYAESKVLFKNSKNKNIYFYRNEELKKANKHIQQYLSSLIHDKKLDFLFSDLKEAGIFKALEKHRCNNEIKKYIKLDISGYYENSDPYMFLKYLNKNTANAADINASLFNLSILLRKDKQGVLKTKKYFIPRGFSQSGLVAFISNVDFFLKLQEVVKKNNGIMTVYVDDIFISLPVITDHQKLLNECWKLAKHNKIFLNRSKTHVNYSNKGIDYHNLFFINNKLIVKNKQVLLNEKSKGYISQIKKFNAL